jgi:hypothetical protein
MVPYDNSTGRALRLPEICDAIFEHLDASSLAAAARVCRAWASSALRALWRAPHPRFVSTDLPAEQRRFYASLVRHVRLDRSLDGALTDWTFQAARRLSVRFDRPFWRVEHARIIIDALARCGPSLVRFGLFPIDEYVAHNHDASVFCYLACRTGLRVLEYKVMVSRDDMSSANAFATRLSRRPFGSLRCLSVGVATDDVAPLVALLDGHGAHEAQVEQLELLVSGPLGGFLADFAPLAPSLRELCIELYLDECDGHFGRQDFRSLARLTQLRKLRLTTGVEREEALYFYDANPLTDDDVAHVAASLPHLHTLLIDIDGMFTGEWFTQLGAGCPGLERLELHAPLDLSLAPSSAHAPLYPQLRELHVDSAKGSDYRYATHEWSLVIALLLLSRRA